MISSVYSLELIKFMLIITTYISRTISSSERIALNDFAFFFTFVYLIFFIMQVVLIGKYLGFVKIVWCI